MTLALHSPLLTGYGFRHGFSLRDGGVSAPPFATLNLGRGLGDVPEAVAENHARLAAFVGYRADRLYEASQVHGATALEVEPVCATSAFRVREADALISAHAGCAVGIRVADCVPVLLAEPASGAVAAVHAGWRGVVDGVVELAVARLMARSGCASGALIAAIFPSIGPSAFAVGDEVAQQIADAAGAACVVRGADGRAYADLGQAVAGQLARAGLAAARVERVPGCTFSEPTRFFSHRRDAGQTGRHLAVIVPRC